jgi:iron-sulfur cluster assembly protein
MERIVDLTAGAVRQVRYLMEKHGKPEAVLRLGVKGGGCSGFSYVLRLDESARETDIVYDADGIRVAVDRKSARLLAGCSLDYSLSNLLGGGWKWTNPGASRSCGCGTSFTPGSPEPSR